MSTAAAAEQSYNRVKPEEVNPTLYNFIQTIRYWLRDFPELNRLIDGEEHSDRMILWAVIDAVDDFNATPPPISLRFEEIPKSILKYGVVITLLQSLAFLSQRNSLAYSDGGITVNTDKLSHILQLQQMMQSAYEEKKRMWKTSRNISQGYDSISTEYRLLAGYYGAW